MNQMYVSVMETVLPPTIAHVRLVGQETNVKFLFALENGETHLVHIQMVHV
jgi:hypothetical protein